ncbi:predicted protein [Nematostella vectensis]|uniref:Spermatogenesis-associated protein 20-like TRX domain-containing protein n=1 Tax=Nematostella vectensis TaxID=45351 RepID=A7SLB5_NEMVE|nr:predicted protein [Nematostella vectensis]|eukprot:XP_001627588.1 predicted protein [Nematostella vectensis]
MAESTDTSPKFTNRLVNEKSPYLLQHKNNPVDWYPWGDEAFQKAKKEQKPIFLSVGYSTCHWCHVMERESFEDENIAKILNENFIPVKVDREERPDVDRVYMTYIQAMVGGGGWPMSLWLTPDLKPFVAGTYFPPNDMAGRPGFGTVLGHIIKQWDTNKPKFTQQSTIVMNAILEHASEIGLDAKDMPNKEVIEKLYQGMSKSFDEELGGFGGAPKFPQPATFNFLFKYHLLKNGTEEGERALHICLKTLECMGKGGIHDHVGQGFHRYSTDRFWHVPHFEKMLYDQAQIAAAYAMGYQMTKDEKFAETCRDILLYVMRDLSHKLGGFYSAEDADSLPSPNATKKTEGAFYVWEEQELKDLLSDSLPTKGGGSILLSELFNKHYGVQAEGNVKPHQDPHKELVKKNVLIVRGSLQDTIKDLDVEEDEAKEQLAKAREILFEERKKRPAPHLDDKMITSWNGLMISGFARSGQVLGEEVYILRAIKAAEFVRTHLYDKSSGELLRSCYRGDKDSIAQIATPIKGYGCDYVYLINGLLDLYEASFDEQWLKWAEELQDKADELFLDKEKGGYFEVTEADKSILVRLKDEQDGAEPSANSLAVMNLMRLGNFVDCQRYRDQAQRIFMVYESRLRQIPLALPELVSNFITHNLGMKQIIIAGDRDADDTKLLMRCVHSHYIPNKVLLLCDGKDGFLSTKLSVFKTLQRVDGKATAYVCQNYTCQLPVTSEEELTKLLVN